MGLLVCDHPFHDTIERNSHIIIITNEYHMIVNKYVVLQNDMGVLLPQQLIGKVCNLHMRFVVIIAFHQVLEWVCSSGYIDIAVLRS